ncbi:MAG: archaeosortase A [Candidatus Thermoplasmatota archaeon]
MEKTNYLSDKFSWIFVIFPTFFIIIGLVFFTYPSPKFIENLSTIPLFIGLGFLFIGFVIKKEFFGSKFKIIGWFLFAFYWATRINTLYFAEQQDLVNALLCIIGIYILFYFAYHEWFSIKRNENIKSLNWIAGASSISGLIYFIIELTPLAIILIEIVAAQSGYLLNIFTNGVSIDGRYILYELAYIRIIFACTAIQSMVIFIGMILPLKNVENKRKIYGLLITVIPIYFLNLIRNAGITYLIGSNITDFYTAHNIIGKGGSLFALIILLFIVVKIVPEVFDEIISLTNLPKRGGPIEKQIKKLFGVKK